MAFSTIDVVNLVHIFTNPKSEDGSHLLPTKKLEINKLGMLF